jgi:hypothetical protein
VTKKGERRHRRVTGAEHGELHGQFQVTRLRSTPARPADFPRIPRERIDWLLGEEVTESAG